jgi:disulfide bond formation protein DsbB
MTHAPFSTATVAAIAALSAAALALAFVAQYGFGLQPCELCLAQRVAFYLTLVLGLLALMPAVPDTARRHVVLLCAGLFAANAVLAAYHAGVEYHWWQGPTACTGGVSDVSTEDLFAALNKPGRVNCDQPALRVLGISMAGGNAIFCALLALGFAVSSRRKDAWSTP